LISYARLVTNDEQSFNVIEVFASQVSELFASLASLLDRESEHLLEDHIGWNLFMQEHEKLTEQLDHELTEFVSLLRAVLRSAHEDQRFLTRHRDSIAQLFLEGSLRIEFLESAEKSIDVEKRFVSSLEFLDDVRKRSVALVKDMRKLLEMFASERVKPEKKLAMIESCRLRASKLHEQCLGLSEHIPGLRDIDASEARKLGMLAQTLRSEQAF
jgi:hypothetical protein